MRYPEKRTTPGSEEMLREIMASPGEPRRRGGLRLVILQSGYENEVVWSLG